MHTRALPLDVRPWHLFRALARKERPFFIDAGQPWGDEWISSMGFGPRMQFRVAAGDAAAGSALGALDDALDACALSARARARPRPVPFAGGAVVALAYETKNAVERVPQTQTEDAGAPRLVCALYDAVVAYDHRRRAWLAASWHLDARALARYAEEVLDAAADARRGACDGEGGDGSDDGNAGGGAAIGPPPPLARNLDPGEYAARVARIHDYIAAGDVYQVNLSLRFEAPLSGPSLDLYGRLRAAQPVPFGRYLDLGPEQVLSASPELFLRRRGTRVTTCPIKGTRPRGATPAEDAALATELLADPKEAAEHVMIVDLERNDLGRLCRTGSVRVERLAELASFRTVHHLVSTVSGELPPVATAGDLLRATFPGGSITGAPKIRAMEIIDEVERGPRGFYTGALGWIDSSGDLDLSLAIRTAVAAGGAIAYHAGGAIVADSRPETEHAECLLKAAAFLRALDLGAAAAASGDGGGRADARAPGHGAAPAEAGASGRPGEASAGAASHPRAALAPWPLASRSSS
jgi:para-aminobenzoate synthetase component 1